jgi:hypothetical protein
VFAKKNHRQLFKREIVLPGGRGALTVFDQQLLAQNGASVITEVRCWG